MSQLHVLAIDDNPQNLKVLAQMLRRQGAVCTEVTNPVAVPGLLPDLGDVDLIFLDLEMPGMDGYQAKDVLRAQLGDTPIIAHTVHVSEINVVRQHGFDGFLGKPLDASRFPEQLARILNGEAVWERG